MLEANACLEDSEFVNSYLFLISGKLGCLPFCLNQLRRVSCCSGIFSSSLEEDIKHFVIGLLGKTTSVIKAGSSNLFFFFGPRIFFTEMILCNRNALLSEPNKHFGRTHFKC